MTSVDEVLDQVETGAGETAEELRAHAEGIMDDFRAAVASLPRLGQAAAELRAKASAIEARDAARQPVAEAEEAVRQAESAYGATAGPEEDAAAEAVKARHLFEAARDQLAEGQRNGIDPAAEIVLEDAVLNAARVDQRRVGILANAQGSRVLAKQDLDRARSQLARARAALAKTEAAVDAPLTADLPLDVRFEALLMTWPIWVAMRGTPGWEMDAKDMAIAAELCSVVADQMDVCPPRLRRQIAEQAAHDATVKLRRTSISIPGVGTTTVGALAGQVPG